MGIYSAFFLSLVLYMEMSKNFMHPVSRNGSGGPYNKVLPDEYGNHTTTDSGPETRR